jgi:DNA-binding transcriptional LysR family regulator
VKIEPKVSSKETIETGELRSFVQVADLRSVTRAARELGVSKSTVSKTLSALEVRLGSSLLERSSRRIEITLTGQMLLERARSVLLELDRLADDVRELQDAVRGQLTVAAPPDLGALLTAEFFPRFLARYPDVRLALRLAYGYVDLQDPSLDVGIRIGTVHDERLVARTIGTVERILVASPRFARTHPLESPAELATCPALTFQDSADPYRWQLQNRQGKLAEVTVSGPLATRNFPALLRAAEADLGVTLVPELLAHESLQRKTLVSVLPAWRQPDAPILLVYRVGHQKLRRVRAFIDFAQEQLAASPSLLPLRPGRAPAKRKLSTP